MNTLFWVYNSALENESILRMKEFKINISLKEIQ